MKVAEIISKVRLCIDEEKYSSDFPDDGMDNVIENNIDYALDWVSRNAPLDKLVSSESSFVKKIETSNIAVSSNETEKHIATITIPSDYLRFIKVRCTSWKKSVTAVITEDSDEYLMLSDATSAASCDRPVAAYIAGSTPKLELWGGEVSEAKDVICYYIASLHGTDFNANDLNLPESLQAAFVYYIAFLVLTAYGDNRAANMLEAAKLFIT